MNSAARSKGGDELGQTADGRSFLPMTLPLTARAMRRLVTLALAGIWRARSRGRVATKLGTRSLLAWHKLGWRVRGTVEVGQDCNIQSRILFDRAGAKVVIGDRCFVGASTMIAAESIVLEDDVVISWGVTIVDHNSHALDWRDRSQDVLDWNRGEKDWSNVTIAPVRLKSRCWIGFDAKILKGVTVGHGAIVAAGSVVTKDVPDAHVVAGNPARTIRVMAVDGGFE